MLRELYDLKVENVTDPALHTLLRAKRDEIARQVTTLEDRDTSRFLYGSRGSVGIDVIGGKVVEINAESPGGMQSVERLYDRDIAHTVIESLERRIA